MRRVRAGPAPTECREGQSELKVNPPPDATAAIPASVVLQRLQDKAPADHFTLGWLMESLGKHSLAIVMLLLALVAMAPAISIEPGPLIVILALQMIIGHLRRSPMRYRHALATRHLAARVQRIVPVLKYLEEFIHARWHTR